MKPICVVRLIVVLSAAWIPAQAIAQDYPQDMPLSRVLIDGAGWTLLSEGHRFTEGPAAATDGSVYFSDIPESRIFKIDPTGKVELFAKNTAKTNGLMVGPDGRLYGCRMGEKRIVAYDARARVHPIADGITANDLVVNSAGDIYCTEPDTGKLWLIPKGDSKRVVAEGLRPNGLILTPDQGTLVVTDSLRPVLWAFRVEADGSLNHKDHYFEPLRTVPGERGPGSDGMTFDKAGRIYVATRAGLQMFDPTGRMGGVILKPQRAFLSNAVFGGPDFAYLYVTCRDKVYRRKTRSPGQPYFLTAREVIPKK